MCTFTNKMKLKHHFVLEFIVLLKLPKYSELYDKTKGLRKSRPMSVAPKIYLEIERTATSLAGQSATTSHRARFAAACSGSLNNFRHLNYRLYDIIPKTSVF